MSRKEAAVLASRTLALLLVVWVLTEVSYLPEYMHSFVHHLRQESVLATAHSYLYWYYLLRLGSLVVRLVGYSLAARWLFKGGPKVVELVVPSVCSEDIAQN